MSTPSMKTRLKAWLARLINANVDDNPADNTPASLVQLYKDVTTKFLQDGRYDHYYTSTVQLHKQKLVGTPMFNGINIRLSISAASRYPVSGIIEIVHEDIIRIMDNLRDDKLEFPEPVSTIGDEYPICFPMDGFPHAESVHQYIPAYTIEFVSPGHGVAPHVKVLFMEVEATENGGLETPYSLNDLIYMLALIALNIQKGEPEDEDDGYDDDDDR